MREERDSASRQESRSPLRLLLSRRNFLRGILAVAAALSLRPAPARPREDLPSLNEADFYRPLDPGEP